MAADDETLWRLIFMANYCFIYRWIRLLKESEKLTAQRNVLLHNTKNHRIYYRYMLRVQGVTDEYNELRDIIARYETLYATHQASTQH